MAYIHPATRSFKPVSIIFFFCDNPRKSHSIPRDYWLKTTRHPALSPFPSSQPASFTDRPPHGWNPSVMHTATREIRHCVASPGGSVVRIKHKGRIQSALKAHWTSLALSFSLPRPYRLALHPVLWPYKEDIAHESFY